MIPTELTKAVAYLGEQNLQLPESHDERAASAEAEGLIVNTLRDANMWEIYSPNEETRHSRAWYDVRIDGYFCNIKVSNCNKYDNANAKKAIYYLLTGDKNAGNVPDEEKEFFRLMKDRENEDENRDYYYLIMNKQDTSDVFVVTLKTLAVCFPALRNPPLQVNWGKCREPAERNWEEARTFLLEKWAEAIRRLLDATIPGMPKYYPEFFPGLKLEEDNE